MMDKTMKWMGLFPSLLFVLVGLLVLIFPAMLSGLAVLVLGVLLLLAGAGYLYTYFKTRPAAHIWDAITGGAGVVFGLLLMGTAFSSATSLVGIVLGIFALVAGLSRLIPAIILRDTVKYWWLMGLIGLGIMVVGVWILTRPAAVTTTLTVLVGILLMAIGVVGCVQYVLGAQGEKKAKKPGKPGPPPAAPEA